MKSKTDVLIVGAGPSGMMTANLLQRAGATYRIIEQTAEPTTESRANIIHGRTLEILDKLGLAGKALDVAVIVRGLNIFQRGKFASYVPFDGPEAVPSRFQHSLGLKQGDMQSLLYEDLRSRGGEVEWRTSFVSVRREQHGVVALINRPDGVQEEIEASYLVAADGGRSPVREAIGLKLEGSTYEQTAFLADVKLAKAYEAERNTLNQTDGGFVGILPYKGDRQYRLFGALSKDFAQRFQAMEQGRSVPVEELNLWFKDVFFLDNEVLEAHWTTIFRIHCRMAPTFQSGRVFLVGDAGHIHAPAGGQGMNLGVGDAFNLGWKLGEVATGRASPSLLDTYNGERRPVAEKIINGSDKGFELEATQSAVLEFFRMYILPTVIRIGLKTKPIRSVFTNLFSQTWINYRGSAAAGAAFPGYRGEFQPGDRFPFLPCTTVDGTRTDTHACVAGTSHTLFVLSGGLSARHNAEQLAASASFPVQVVELLAGSPSNEKVHEAFPGVDMLLVRPDGHMASVAKLQDLSTIRDYLARFGVRAPAAMAA